MTNGCERKQTTCTVKGGRTESLVHRKGSTWSFRRGYILSPQIHHVIANKRRDALSLYLSTVICIDELQMGFPPVKNTLAITRKGLPILHWRSSSSPRAAGPPPLFHGYLDTHSPEWRHTAMNPGICDPATDRHSSATDSIKLQIKAGTSKGLCGGSMEMWQWKGNGNEWGGDIEKKKYIYIWKEEASFMRSPNVTV